MQQKSRMGITLQLRALNFVCRTLTPHFKSMYHIQAQNPHSDGLSRVLYPLAPTWASRIVIGHAHLSHPC